MTTTKEIINITLSLMDSICQAVPLSNDFKEDGRYSWPERWKRLRQALQDSAEDKK